VLSASYTNYFAHPRANLKKVFREAIPFTKSSQSQTNQFINNFHFIYRKTRLTLFPQSNPSPISYPHVPGENYHTSQNHIKTRVPIPPIPPTPKPTPAHQNQPMVSPDQPNSNPNEVNRQNNERKNSETETRKTQKPTSPSPSYPQDPSPHIPPPIPRPIPPSPR
jgi:hypothetical protein